VHYALRAFGFGDVGCDRVHDGVRGPQLGGSGRQFVLIAAVNYYLAALASQRECNGAANPLARSGDESNPVFESCVHEKFSYKFRFPEKR
jgi:hypothetical protein